MSHGNSSINNLPISKDSSRSSSPFLNYISYEDEARFLNSTNSRFQKVPVLRINSKEMDINENQVDQTRKNRFTVVNVDEKNDASDPLLGNNNNKPRLLEIDNNLNNTDTMNSQRSDHSKKSVLKKTITKYDHDDSLIEKEPVVPKQPELFDDDDDEEDDDNDNTTPDCIKINYNKRKEARSVTVNCGSPTVNSYMGCFTDIKKLSFYKKLIAEYIGTMFLVLYVCSIGLRVTEKEGVPSINGAIGSGLIISTIVWCLGSISGSHLNPAVTIAFFFTGKINPLASVLYVGFQLLGALTGSYILRDLVPDYALAKLSVTEIHPALNTAQAFGIEFIITFILVLTVFSCVDENRSDLNGSFPLSIGIAIIIGSLFGGPFTGGSMNPARSFGPAVVMNIWKDHWVYWVGPISGGIVAGILYKFILTSRCIGKRSRQKSAV